ncbi:MAG TPA: hypothetical protein VHB20_14590 [Verrucomicrobiae bacterium]|jgi:hypothetical protein|nr:hypothetical protein [Verrucomicrobiae bacterium]
MTFSDYVNLATGGCVVIIALLVRVSVARRILIRTGEPITSQSFTRVVLDLRRWLCCLCFLLLLSGCASPHREAVSRHTTELYQGRPDGLVKRDIWEDRESGGGHFLFTDPAVQSMNANHVNQSSLGGSNTFTTGAMTLVVDTNTGQIVAATGAAVGNIVGAALKTAVK